MEDIVIMIPISRISELSHLNVLIKGIKRKLSEVPIVIINDSGLEFLTNKCLYHSRYVLAHSSKSGKV